MRNLKRALSLAMASVMLLGLMVVGTGASYKDVTSEQNVEAIEVLQAVEIMVGDENGDFNPDQNVTRNEMAVVMANLMDYRVASYAGTSPFTDVPEWAEPYVAACYSNGIVAGTSATTYGGDQSVTTAQAALMLMKALGYFQYQSDFENDWQLATVKQATLIDLFNDVSTGVREAMTRNDVAQLVLNTLEAGTVIADDDTIKVEADGVTVEAGKVTYNYITSGLDYAQAIDDLGPGYEAAGTSTAGAIVELGEKLYQGDLKRYDDDQDGFGAPATRWTYNSQEIGTYADSADYVFTGGVKSSAMYSAIGKTAVTSGAYAWNVYVDGTDGNRLADLNADGDFSVADFRAQVDANNNADMTGPGRGTVTYVYVDDSVGAKAVTVCIVSTYAAEIAEVDGDTIVLADLVDGNVEFDVTGYEEDDVVLYTKSYDHNGDPTVEAVLGLAEYVEGTVDTVKDVDTVIISDTTYKYNTTVPGNEKITIDSYDQKVGFYLDQQGHIVLIGDAVESGDYAYVISAGYEADKYGSDDFVVNAKLVLEDGTVVRVEIDDDDYLTGDTTGEATKNYFEGAIVTYVVNDDGTYSLTFKTNPVAAVNDQTIVKGGTSGVMNIGEAGTVSYGDANTIYLVCDDAENDEYSVYIGYKNVPDLEAKGDGSTMAAYVEGTNGVAKFVFITGGVVKLTADDVVFVIGRNNEKVIKTSAGNYYEYKAVVKGESTVIRVKEGSDAEGAFWSEMGAAVNASNKPVSLDGVADKQVLVFYGMTENSKGLVTDLETVNSDVDLRVYDNLADGVRRQNNAGLIGFEYAGNGDYDTWMGAEDDAVVAYYEANGNTLSEVGGISSLKTDTKANATVVTYEGSIIAILVKEFK